ncbi:sigma-70 family RNA polymerase sigma factor [Mesobacillus selenatarsenatis]|uniref:Sigma-70 family RNA polymerase sigma factor n=1 Tax=Mesobacillus selenatarsenatis TaxID=388741 RepID=A0A846TUW1_9BACI|nr:sigma-70 family RNA polymerase sigma factor [Mesobacillus selenatarsenatis]NKE06131.1 sigma-70 family RNA polymerase sigma factor [Mesobacillus selenatarsenatis]
MLSLIKKAQRGNAKAFLELFQQYEQDLYRMAYIYVKNENDALDVVQETAYKSFKSIKELKEPQYFKSWLIRIAISCSLDILRKRKKAVPLKPDFEEFISGAVHEDLTLEITLRGLIEELREEEKSVILLRFYQGMTLKEVSETLDIPLGSSKTILYRGLEKLRKKWKGDDACEQ